MTVTMRVLLDPTRMPSPTAWAREIRAQGFEMDLDVEFDPKTHSGFLPCVHQGHPTGFEYFFLADAALDDQVRRAAGSERTLEICFLTNSDMRELVCAMIASGVLAQLSDGVVWSDESGDSFSGPHAINLARDTERELMTAKKFDFSALERFLQRVPAISDIIGKGVDDGLWWVKFSIDIDHPLAWRVVQELGQVLNYLSVNERLPTVFMPVSPPSYLNGGPREYLSWVIESKTSDFEPKTCAEWLEGRLPKPVDEAAAWKLHDDDTQRRS